jgi:hypothetical protein
MLLICHPDFPCPAITRVAVDVGCAVGGEWSFRYVVTGRINALRIPPAAAPARVDGLWRHTCFEAFLRAGEGYAELNFSPAREWAAYRFAGYRSGMQDAAELGPPHIGVRLTDDSLEVNVRITLAAAGRPLRIGLAAVIEDSAGALSYWALAHPAGRPDFHHPDCFALDYPAA